MMPQSKEAREAEARARSEHFALMSAARDSPRPISPPGMPKGHKEIDWSQPELLPKSVGKAPIIFQNIDYPQLINGEFHLPRWCGAAFRTLTSESSQFLYGVPSNVFTYYSWLCGIEPTNSQPFMMALDTHAWLAVNNIERSTTDFFELLKSEETERLEIISGKKSVRFYDTWITDMTLFEKELALLLLNARAVSDWETGVIECSANRTQLRGRWREIVLPNGQWLLIIREGTLHHHVPGSTKIDGVAILSSIKYSLRSKRKKVK